MPTKSRSIVSFLRDREYGLVKQGSSNIDERLMEDKATIPAKNQACELSGQCRSTFLMTFSPDGNRIASAHGDHTVRVTLLATGACTHVLRGHPRSPWCIAFHPCQNDLLASGCLGGQVRIWDLRGGGSELWTAPTATVIASLTFHPTDQLLVIATHNELFFWDWTQAEPFTSCKTSTSVERVRWVKFDPLGQFLLTGIANNSADSEDDRLRGAQVSFATESGASNIGEHQRLQDRYRHLVNQINSNQSQRINEVYPLGSAVRAAMNARPPQVQTFGGEQILVPPAHAEIDIIEPRSPVSHDPEDPRGSFAARVTSITSQALANARRYAAHVTEQSARMAMQDDERQVIRIRNEHAVDNNNDNDDEPSPQPSPNIIESGLSNIVGPPELLSGGIPVTTSSTHISPPMSFRPRARVLNPREERDSSRPRLINPGESTRNLREAATVSRSAARGLSMLLDNLERRDSRSPLDLSLSRPTTSQATSRSQDSTRPSSSIAVPVQPGSSPSRRSPSNASLPASDSTRPSTSSASGVGLSQSILRCQLAASTSSSAPGSEPPPVSCTSSCNFCSNVPSSIFTNAPLSNASESLANTSESGSTSSTQRSYYSPRDSGITRALLQSLQNETELNSDNGFPTTIEETRNTRGSVSNSRNSARTTIGSSPVTTWSSPQSLGSLVARSPHLSSILNEHRRISNILNSRNSERSEQSNVRFGFPNLPDPLDIPPPHPWNDPLNSIGQHLRNQDRRSTSSSSPSMPPQFPGRVPEREREHSHQLRERLDHLRQRARQCRERREERMVRSSFLPPVSSYSVSNRGNSNAPPGNRLHFIRERIADRRRRLRERLTDFRRHRGSSNSTQYNERGSPPSNESFTEEEPWDLTRPRPSSPLRMQQIRSRIFQREQERRSWHAMERRQLHPHYSVSILDDTVNRSDHGLQAAINRAIAGAYVSTGEMAVATNIVNLTHRVQSWDFTKTHIPDISQSTVNIIVPHCKLHNDSSCDISSDGRYLATFVPIHRGFPDDTVLAVYSLLPESKGQCLYTKSFGPNVVSVSISPLSNYILVGLASKKLAWVFTPKQMVAQVFKLKNPKAGEDSMDHICDLMHPCDVDIRSNVSVNATRWLPRVGDGLVYGTTRGDLHICRPGYVEDPKTDSGTSGGAGSLQGDLMHMLGISGRTNSTATQTVQRVRRSAATQTDQSHSSNAQRH